MFLDFQGKWPGRYTRLSIRRADLGGGGESGGSPVGAWFETPWGDGVVIVRSGRLLGVELPPVRGARDGFGSTDETRPEDVRALQRWTLELEGYFRGERLSWSPADIRPELEQSGLSRFARRTVEALMEVPAGSTVAYGELASLAGHPRAARAVGSVMASNSIPIVIPCHRVIRSDGSLGRYGNDPSWKERLLEHERRTTQEIGG